MKYKHDTITIEKPVPGRYQIAGFRAHTVYVPDQGHLSPPMLIDLPMTVDLAEALEAVLDDYTATLEGAESRTKPEPQAEADDMTEELPPPRERRKPGRKPKIQNTEGRAE